MQGRRQLGRILAGLVLATGLGGCATAPDGLTYADGSYYSAASEGRGDYYVGRSYDSVRYVGDPFFDDFLWLYDGGPWYGGWYGSPFYGYGGYCSVRYRYCPPGGWGWADPFPRYDFQLYFGDPWRYGHGWRDPWYDARPYDRWRSPPSRPRNAPPPRGDNEASPPDGTPDARPPRPPEQRAPEPRPPRRVRDPMSNDGDEPFPRARRAAPPRRDPPPPAPRAGNEDGN